MAANPAVLFLDEALSGLEEVREGLGRALFLPSRRIAILRVENLSSFVASEAGLSKPQITKDPVASDIQLAYDCGFS